MIKRAHYHQQYLLIKEAHRIYPDFDTLSEMEKQAVLRHLKRGAKKGEDAYTHAGRRLGAKLEASNLPTQGVIDNIQTSATILGTGGGSTAAGTSFVAGMASLKKATEAASRLSQPAWKQRRHTYVGLAGQARRIKDKALVKYHGITSEAHLGKVQHGRRAADSVPIVYNNPTRFTPATPFQLGGLM